MGQICNTTTILGQVSSGISLFLPIQLNKAMTISKTLPFQASNSSTSQSLPPRYNALSGRIPISTRISLGASNPPGGPSSLHPYGSHFYVGTQVPIGGKPLVGGQNYIMGQPFTG
jgi:hypothetical protein